MRMEHVEPGDELQWQALLAWHDGGPPPGGESALLELYRPLCKPVAGAALVVGHLAQSLDGRIATLAGVSQWLSGAEDLLHTHRMRALFDAVLVGIDTVLADDPQLTVRRCTGRNPVRVVVDPQLRGLGRQRVFRDGAAPTLVLAAQDAIPGRALGDAEIVRIPRGEAGIDPHAMLRVLAERGITRLFIEGGGVTVSRFLAARALDRLQLTVAPVILGSGRLGVALPAIVDLRDGLRPRVRRFVFGDDVLFECDFRG